MSAILEQQVCRPIVIPWYAQKETFGPDTLPLIYQQLKAEDILSDVLHEKMDSEEEFVRFVTSPSVLLHLFYDQEYRCFAGLAWLTDVVATDCFRRAIGSFAFFRSYQCAPITNEFGRICLDQWFNTLEIDVVGGISPRSNVVAQRYCRRLGFTYHGAIPNWTCRRGKVTDAMPCTLTREQFNSRPENLKNRIVEV